MSHSTQKKTTGSDQNQAVDPAKQILRTETACEAISLFHHPELAQKIAFELRLGGVRTYDHKETPALITELYSGVAWGDSSCYDDSDPTFPSPPQCDDIILSFTPENYVPGANPPIPPYAPSDVSAGDAARGVWRKAILYDQWRWQWILGWGEIVEFNYQAAAWICVEVGISFDCKHWYCKLFIPEPGGTYPDVEFVNHFTSGGGWPDLADRPNDQNAPADPAWTFIFPTPRCSILPMEEWTHGRVLTRYVQDMWMGTHGGVQREVVETGRYFQYKHTYPVTWRSIGGQSISIEEEYPDCAIQPPTWPGLTCCELPDISAYWEMNWEGAITSPANGSGYYCDSNGIKIGYDGTVLLPAVDFYGNRYRAHQNFDVHLSLENSRFLDDEENTEIEQAVNAGMAPEQREPMRRLLNEL